MTSHPFPSQTYMGLQHTHVLAIILTQPSLLILCIMLRLIFANFLAHFPFPMLQHFRNKKIAFNKSQILLMLIFCKMAVVCVRQDIYSQESHNPIADLGPCQAV